MFLENDKIVVVPDLHGQIEPLEKVYAIYGPNVSWVIDGDAIDKGPDSCLVLQMAKDIGAYMVATNHSWMLNAVMHEARPSFRDVWMEEWLLPKFMSDATPKSYGIVADRYTYGEINELREVMRELGHLSLLQDAHLYIETESMVVTHAGVSSESWESQRQYLDEVYAKTMAPNFHFDDEPRQICDFKYSNRNTVPWDANGRTFVNGHSHIALSLGDRKIDTAFGTKVKLASSIYAGEPLYVYESWSGEVVEIR